MLRTLLSSMSPEIRDRTVDACERLRDRLIETLDEKFRWCDHCPYIAIGSHYSLLDGDIVHGKALMTAAIQEYDEAVQK